MTTPNLKPELDPANLDAYCPTCGARPGALCHSPSGTVLVRPHKSRGKAKTAKAPKGVSRTVRLALVRRSGGWCESCPKIDPGAPKHPGEDPHHVLRRSQGGTDDVDNLVWTCRRGHRLIHDNPKRSYELGLLVKSGGAR